ncbi:MAG: hypothetical protein WBA74_23965 [Cyclobacteriaceae bacterium]
MALIKNKKLPYPISNKLREYLIKFDRECELPVSYEDLLRYDNAIPLYDKNGNDTLWLTIFYPQLELIQIYNDLKKVYALLKADGDMEVIEHLSINRVDLCVYGNTQPLRIRIVNQLNDNFDYFYIKKADASRIYGLELEDLLSPNRISYLVHKDTLIEEHIVGIPGDQFIKENLKKDDINQIRLAKEFVKFNERCFVRLLGDMHSSNFIVDVTPDFEEVSYRIRAIDFDQQSYEGRKAIYLPQYFKQNNPLIQIGIKNLTRATVRQYQREERTLIGKRLKVARHRIKNLTDTMAEDRISKDAHVRTLKKELAEFYEEPDFLRCNNMGEVLKMSLLMLIKKPNLYHDAFEK